MYDSPHFSAALPKPLSQEPDLYTSHGNRPNIKNYTLENYIDVSEVELLFF